MCLSTAYKNRTDPDCIAMRNVKEISCRAGEVLLTDLMGHTLSLEGTLEKADLVNGFVVIRSSCENQA